MMDEEEIRGINGRGMNENRSERVEKCWNLAGLGVDDGGMMKE